MGMAQSRTSGQNLLVRVRDYGHGHCDHCGHARHGDRVPWRPQRLSIFLTLRGLANVDVIPRGIAGSQATLPARPGWP